MISSTESLLDVRGRRVRLLRWANPGAVPMVMLHGWMDVSDSFEFIADAFGSTFDLYAPDQRGYGGSEASKESATGYWFHDYLADLDALLDQCFGDRPIVLMGHSLGGHVATLYAGLRPGRVIGLVSLDGFGLTDEPAEAAPEKVLAWLDSVKAGPKVSSFSSLASLADRIQSNDALLTREQALWVAQSWATPTAEGRFALRADPAHRLPFPTTYRLAESMAIWRRVTAPTLWIGADQSFFRQRLGYSSDHESHSASFQQRLDCFAKMKFVSVSPSTHMVHHDQPKQCAAEVIAWWKSLQSTALSA